MNLLFGINMHTELKINLTEEQLESRSKALAGGLAFELRPNFLLFSTMSPERLTFETFEEYKFRQKISRKVNKR